MVSMKNECAKSKSGPQTYRPRKAEATSFLMSRVRNHDTRMEIGLRSALQRAGYRFRKNVKGVFGKPDIVFRRAQVAVFVDGDFWHARILKEQGLDALRRSLKTRNRDFWVSKLRRNYTRDLEVTAELERDGWLVLRLWESDLKKRMNKYVRVVSSAVDRRTAACP
jgi:DNA mismatch endonuclease (patch repair protein)